MENIMPILLSVSGIFLGISIFVKVILGMKFKKIKYRQLIGLLEHYILFFASVIMMWFLYKYNGDDLKLKRLKCKINRVTFVFYGLVILEGIFILIPIH